MRMLRNLFRQLIPRSDKRVDSGTTAAPAKVPALSVGEFLKSRGVSLAFNLLDIGARPVEGQDEPFRRLLSLFPASRLSAVEIDPVLCEELNRSAAPNVRYYPCALGRTDEVRTLHVTAHPMCSSLYPTDERYIDMFQNLEDMRPARTMEVSTISLDRFAEQYALGALDFVKLDIQGAELEVLRGGTGVLGDILMMISEVEFVPLYRGQPLYGDVDAFLRSHGFMLHKLLGMAGRLMRPFKLNGTGNYPVQFLWSDAVFVRDLFALDTLAPEQLLKLAVLLDLYESRDVALHALTRHDALRGTRFAAEFRASAGAAGPWELGA